MNAKARATLPALIALLACGCAATGGATHAPPLPSSMRTEPARFVVVTVRNEPRALSALPGSTPRGYDGSAYYGVTAAASAAVRSLERDYGLEEVSAWPIASLRVHCIVFRVPTASTPAQMVAQLQHDSRVESAQNLN
jgi:hypothetical protein